MHAASYASNIVQCIPVIRKNTINILIIYDLEEEKMKLAEALVKLEEKWRIKVHLAKSLPLSAESQKHRHINYVIILLDMTRRHSYKVFEEAVRHIDIQFFMGRCLFITINMSKKQHACNNFDSIRDLQRIYQTEFVHGNFDNEEKIHNMTSIIMTNIKLALKL